MNLETDSKLFLTEEETRDFLAAETAKAKRAQPLKPGTLDMIVEAVRHAREKHPDWRKTQDYVVSVAELEWNEVRHAIAWESRKRAKAEALDLVAVLVRFIEGDAE